MKQRGTVFTLWPKMTFTKSVEGVFGFNELLFELMLWILLCTSYNTVQIKSSLESFLLGFFLVRSGGLIALSWCTVFQCYT